MLERINRLCLELCIALLNHKLGDNKYKSVIISGLVVIGFCNNRGWLNIEDYTTKYLGVIKVVQMLVIYWLYIEQEDRYKMNQKFIDNIQAQLGIELMFNIVRRRVCKFITLVLDRS